MADDPGIPQSGRLSALIGVREPPSRQPAVILFIIHEEERAEEREDSNRPAVSRALVTPLARSLCAHLLNGILDDISGVV